VAAFLRSKCTTDSSHKIVILDHSNGDLKAVIPYSSTQEVFQHQFLFQHTGSDVTSHYAYSVFVASNSTGSADQYKLFEYKHFASGA
jgi:hypothetical protein